MLLLNKRFCLILLLIGFGFYTGKSQNLISNGSFEQLNMPINWATWGGGFFDNSVFPEQQIVSNWNVFNSPDYFTSDYPYSNKLYWQPSNWFGNSNTKEGNSYAGIYIYKKSNENKEYISQQLVAPLKADTIYCLSFFTTRADRMPYAVKNIGAYFSIASPTLINSYINAIPQVLNANSYITDTINWVEIQGCFTAQGGEQYITIGNFNSNANTDTLRIPSTNPLTGTGTDIAYYYIDSVSLWKNNFPTSIKEGSRDEFMNIYPNPTSSVISIKIAEGTAGIDAYRIKITDVLGREILISEYKEQLNISQLQKGIYFLNFYKSNELICTRKIVRE